MSDNQPTTALPAQERIDQLTTAIVQHLERGEIEQAHAVAEQAQRLAGESPGLLGLVCVARANIARRQAHYTETLFHAHEALRLFVQAGDTQRQRTVLITIGTVYFELGDYGQAIEALSQATEQAVVNSDLALEANAAFWLAACYQRMNLFEQALQACARSEQIYDAENDSAGLARALNCRHIVYREMSLRDEAQREMLQQQAQATLDQALYHARRADSPQMSEVLRGNQGRLHAACGRYEQALEIYEEQVRSDTNYSPINLSLLGISKGTALRHLGRFPEALQALEAALEIAAGAQLKRELALAHHELAQTYEALGDSGRALQHYKQYHETERMILSEHNDRIARVTALRLEAERGRYQAELQNKLTQQEHEALREKTTLLEQLIQERTAALDRQAEMLQLIDDLSTPILPVLKGVLLLPIVGRLDDRRCMKMTQELLQQVSQQQAQVVLLDITGMLIIDPAITAALLDLARAVRLLGGRVIIVGIRPEIAQAIVEMGLSFSGVTSHATLAEGVQAALMLVGLSWMPQHVPGGALTNHG